MVRRRGARFVTTTVSPPLTSLADPATSPALAKKLLVLCPFPQGVAAGQRLKYEQYFDDWQADGYDITVSSFMDEALWKIVYASGNIPAKVLGVLRGHLRRIRDMFRLKNYDVIYVFMWVTPFGTSLFERLVRRLGARVIYDLEDNVLVGHKLKGADNLNRLTTILKGSRKARFLICTADHVITSSPFLNDDCLKLNQAGRCTYITSSVDTDRYHVRQTPNPSGKVTLGWTGTFSSRPFLDLLRPVFMRLARERDFRLVVIGNFDYALEGVDLEVIQWTNVREITDLQQFDIGLYPLPIDDWVLGKSGLKVIQYMAMGIASVSTKVGTTPMIIEDGVTGLLVESEDDWLGALHKLIDDADLRQRMGARARKVAEQRYSLRSVRNLYRSVINETAEAAAPDKHILKLPQSRI